MPQFALKPSVLKLLELLVTHKVSSPIAVRVLRLRGDCLDPLARSDDEQALLHTEHVEFVGDGSFPGVAVLFASAVIPPLQNCTNFGGNLRELRRFNRMNFGGELHTFGTLVWPLC